jgi:hypothetical protein
MTRKSLSAPEVGTQGETWRTWDWDTQCLGGHLACLGVGVYVDCSWELPSLWYLQLLLQFYALMGED